MCVAKAKVLISCMVTAQLVCVFVNTHAKSWSSNDAAHIIYLFRGSFICFLYTKKNIYMAICKTMFWQMIK